MPVSLLKSPRVSAADSAGSVVAFGAWKECNVQSAHPSAYVPGYTYLELLSGDTRIGALVPAGRALLLSADQTAPTGPAYL